MLDNESQSRSPPTPLPPLLPLITEELLIRYMAEVDTELLCWEALEGFDFETMGTINLIDF